MKLPSPRELNTKLQEQNSSEAKAGLFLAKKVDALREAVQEEQVIHDKAIEGMRHEYEIFSTEQSTKKYKILKEIEDLEEKIKILRVPLDSEWLEVKETSKKNSENTLFLEEKDKNLIKRENDNIELSENLLKRQGVIENSEIRSKSYLEFASDQKKKSEQILLDAQEYEKQIKESIEIRTKAITKRETDIAYREVDVENRNKNALSKEENNRKQTLSIESKQKQLSAAFAELEKRNGTIYYTDR